jgi:tol-pal system protein YbgF
MKYSLSTVFLLGVSLTAFSSFAQAPGDPIVTTTPQPRPLLDMQQAAAPVVNGNAPQQLPEGPAQLEVRIGALEEQLREMNGKIEEDQFQIRKLTESLDKQQRDTDFRFGELAHPTAPTAVASSVPAPAAEVTKRPEATPVPALKAKETPLPDSSVQPGLTTSGDGLLQPPGNPDATPATPRDLYNYAFRLLNQTKYEEAATAFQSFTKKYPKDPLVGNAYYWMGETYYIRRDYVNAADSFRQGFETVPNGPKASDNLLKLAMSLDALNRDKEACVVLQQIVTKFKKGSISVSDKAEAEQKRINCQY